MITAIQKRYLAMLRQIVLSYAENHPVKIWLFGSYAKEKAHRYSDIDIAILPVETLSPNFISDLKEKVEKSTIPYLVDIIDLSQTDEKFREKVISEGILWKD